MENLPGACDEVAVLAEALREGLSTRDGSSRKSPSLSSTAVVVGCRPVSIEVREGLQSGNWQYARAKRTPVAASLSTLGETMPAAPYDAISGRQSSVARKRTLSFSAASEVAAATRKASSVPMRRTGRRGGAGRWWRSFMM